jgi:hypothetical protein
MCQRSRSTPQKLDSKKSLALPHPAQSFDELSPCVPVSSALLLIGCATSSHDASSHESKRIRKLHP